MDFSSSSLSFAQTYFLLAARWNLSRSYSTLYTQSLVDYGFVSRPSMPDDNGGAFITRRIEG